MSDRARRIAWLAGLALVVLLGGGAVADFYAEHLWFGSLGYEPRFWKLRLAELAAWTVVLLVVAGVLWWVVRSTLERGGPIQIRRQLGDLEIAEALPDRWVGMVVAAGAVVAGLLVAGPFSSPLARQTLFALEAAPWGETDPILGRDPRFYVFFLPLLRTVWSAAVAVLTWTAIGLGSVLLLTGRVRATEQGIEVDRLARRRLVGLGAAILAVVAAHFGLSTWEIVAGGPVGYVEVHAEIPARRLVAILALLSAGAVLWGQRTERWRPAVVTLVLTAVVWPLGTAVYPGLVQRFRVEPNELQLERPFLDAEIEATRSAFGLDRIRRVDYPLRESAPPLETVNRHVSGLPLWDERPLKATYDQLQGLLAYHEFPDVDADRYGEPGNREQVAVGVREFAPGLLDQSARTWQNLHLRYTHGTGWVVTAVDQATEGGEPMYYVRDLPPTLSGDAPDGLTVEEPNVYFGERTTQYVMVPPDSFPSTGRPAGVPLSGLFRRGMLAWALESKNILLRNPGAGDPMLMWRRHVVRRVRHLVPFLLVDSDVYPVIHEGRVKWIAELYSGTDRYPLSEPVESDGTRANYLRSVAKAVVDGVSGEVTIYTVDPDEPLLATYGEVFPGLFEPLEAMPGALRDHLRYPRELFRIQARKLEAYHMTEVDEFYQRQDLWSLGQEVYGGRPRPVEPYFLLMPFPDVSESREADGAAGGDGAAGEDVPAAGPAARQGARPADTADAGAESSRFQQEFLLTAPFTPRNRDNLASFLMARNDGRRYGELWLFDLSGQEQVFGPRQVEVQIDQDPVISQQLTLWQQSGSRAIRGHLLLVPVEGYLIYIEPLFLVAEDREGAAPGMKRVIAAAGDRVAMDTTLDGAVEALLGKGAPAAPAPEGEPAAEEPAPERAPDAAPRRPGTMSLERLRSLLQRADSALRAGDLERFGRLWEQLRSSALPPPAGAAGQDTAAGRP